MWQRRTLLSNLALAAVLLLATGSGAASPSQVPEAAIRSWAPAKNLSQSPDWSLPPQVVADHASGDLWVLWAEAPGTPPTGEVLMLRYLGATGTWTSTFNLSNSPQDDRGAVMHRDEDGLVHVAWTRRCNISDTNTTDLVYRRWDGSTWLEEEVIDHNAETYIPSPYGLFFVQDARGDLCLFVTIGSGVRHTCLRQGGWEDLTPWVYISGMQAMVDIVRGPDGYYHAAVLGENAYEDFGGCDEWMDDAYYTISSDGEIWTPLANLSHFGTIAYDVSLVFDPAGRLHVLWSDIHPSCSLDSKKSAIYGRVLEGEIWGERHEVTPYNENQAINDMDILVGPAGRFHLAWSEGLFENEVARDLAIRYCRWTDGSCGQEEIVSSSPESSRNVSLALHSGIVPVVVWQEGPAMAQEVFFGQRGEILQVFLPLLFRPEAASTAETQ